jgi:hypothetical protein
VAEKLRLKEKVRVLELHSTKFVTTLQFVYFGGGSKKFLHVATNQISELSFIEQSVLCAT